MGVSTFWRFFARPQKLRDLGHVSSWQTSAFGHVSSWPTSKDRFQPKTHHFLRSLKNPRVGFGEDVPTWVPGYVTFREVSVLGAWPSVALTFWCSFGVVKHRFYVEWNLVKLAKEFEDLPRICRRTSDKFLVLIVFFNFVFEKEDTAFVFQSLQYIPSNP